VRGNTEINKKAQSTQAMNIHKKAVALLGAKARIEKLRSEALELALACDRYLDERCELRDVIAELMDVRFVGHSLRYIGDDQRELSVQGAWKMDDGRSKLEGVLKLAEMDTKRNGNHG
jgi:hypothetical protein